MQAMPEHMARQTPRYDVGVTSGAVACSRIVSLVSYPGYKRGRAVQVPELIKLDRRSLHSDCTLVFEGTLDGTYVANFARPDAPNHFLFFSIGANGIRLLRQRQRTAVKKELARAAIELAPYDLAGGGDLPRHYLGIPFDVVAELT
jgi:hypothetical protein